MRSISSCQKGCLCHNKRHDRTWHCIVDKSKGSVFYADFPFGNPPTKGTGLWSKTEFHKIRNWGRKRS